AQAAPTPLGSLALAVPCLRSNIIDVSAADSQGMEQHEYMDRARQYSTRLAMLSNNLTHWKKLPLLPSLTNQPHQVLASDPVPFADLQQVRGPWGSPAGGAGRAARSPRALSSLGWEPSAEHGAGSRG
uniref:Ragulator complex protein LAMTOR1 n=1 Tax=Anser brachyrhynchus TaxID=132585 RepID=A0A8B9BN03_9AVES